MTRIEQKHTDLIFDQNVNALADRIGQLVLGQKQELTRTVNHVLVSTYWNIGKYIVEFEQKGNAKAQYGTALLSSLSKLLQQKFGKGYSRPNLNNMRKFYLLYPICQTVSDKSLKVKIHLRLFP